MHPWPREIKVRGPFVGGDGYTVYLRNIVRGLLAQGIAVEGLNVGASTRPPRDEPWMAGLALPRPNARIALQVIQPLWARRLVRTTTVNATMFEADRLPDPWRAPAMAMPLTILPSRHCADLWLEAGVDPARVRIVPLGIDGARFAAPDAGYALPPALDGRAVDDRQVRFLTRSGPDRRKNLAGVVAAWIAATTPADDAALVIKAPPVPPAGAPDGLIDALAAGERMAGRSFASAAPVAVIRAHLPDADMPRLYAAATHFISASHGEGWDLPMTEAAAAGLTLIAPDHTGYREYLDASVATMIPSALVAVEPGAGHFFDGLRWWEPDREALVLAIRAAVAGAAQARGAQARILAEFSIERVTVALLDAIGSALPEAVAASGAGTGAGE